MTNLGWGFDMTGDVRDVLVIMNLVALAVFVVTLHIARIERSAHWLLEQLHKLRLHGRKSLE